MMDLFDEIANANVSQSSEKFFNYPNTQGLVCVNKVLLEKMNDGLTFVLETVVVQASAKVTGDVKVPQKGAPLSDVQKLQIHKSAKGNTKAIILALVGKSDLPVDQFKTLLDKMRGESQPARGMLLAYDTVQKTVKKGERAGQTNTYAQFKHIDAASGNSKEAIAERRAKLEKGETL